MAEWRFGRGWSNDELTARLARARASVRNFDINEEMTAERGWHRHYSRAIIAREAPGPPEPDGPYERAWPFLERYAFSDPRIVKAHFDAAAPFVGRVMLLEARVLGLHYLGAAVVAMLRNARDATRAEHGFRYDTLDCHFERGSEWFIVGKDIHTGDITFTIHAVWRRGQLPNFWSRIGFTILAPRYQRAWHRLAHLRLRALLGSVDLEPLPRGARLVHQGPPLNVARVQETADGPAPEPITTEDNTLSSRTGGFMKEWLLAYGIGAVCGSRSLLVPALLANTSAGPWPLAGPLATAARSAGGRALMAAMATAELLADKSVRIPARTDALPLGARVTTGALSALACARPSQRVPAAVAGAIGALTGAYLFFHLRRLATARLGVPAIMAGAAEDALAIGVGTALMRCR